MGAAYSVAEIQRILVCPLPSDYCVLGLATTGVRKG